jgi:hypothetical protein
MMVFLGVRYRDADLNFISQLNVLKAPPYPKNGLKIILRSFMKPIQVFFENPVFTHVLKVIKKIFGSTYHHLQAIYFSKTKKFN